MLSYISERKKVIIVFLIICVLGIFYIKNSTNEEILGEQEEVISNIIDTEQLDETERIMVYIVGAVKEPGVVEVEEGSRIKDVIDKAGGFREDADITDINLAFVVNDGIKIKVPSINEDEKDNEYITEGSGENVILSENSLKNKEVVVNINTATQAELETLSGIGASLATRIIEYREANGKFKNIEEIKNVTGIGESKFENIKDYIDI